MSIELVLTDLDGTLVDQNGEISSENLSMIYKLKEKGIEFGIATGRPFQGAERLVKNYGLEDYIDYYITMNGLELYDVKKSIKEYEKFLNKKHIVFCFELFKDLDCHFVVVHDGKLLTDKITNYSNKEAEINKLDIIESNDFINDLKDEYPKLIIAGDPNILKIAEERLNLENTDFNYFKSHEFFLEVLPKNVSKGETLKKITNKNNVDLQKVVTFGDNNNDIHMIKLSGIGVAVNNATPQLKNKANIISEYTNEESAFSRELKKLVK